MTTLPAAVTYGFVTARILLAVGDTTDDFDRFPDAVSPSKGSVIFRPKAPILVSGSSPSTLVLKQQVICSIGSTGEMLDTARNTGVWLVAGQYSVQINTASSGDPSSFLIEVTAAHTQQNPLDLILRVPVGKVGPIPQWQLLTEAEYQALPETDPNVLYLIGRMT